MKHTDWLLAFVWAVFVALLGPFLFSAHSTLLVLTGFLVLLVLLNYTAWRLLPVVRPLIKEWLK